MKIYAENLEEEAFEQFKACLADPSCVDGALMPDAHTGYTLPIGWVILSKWKIFPSYVWYDIWCGMCSIKTDISKKDIIGKEKEIFDLIYENIPCGEWKWGSFTGTIDLPITEFWAQIFKSNGNQIWTLWGWNHFIEIGYDENDIIWVTIHSWSRWFWYKIADHYMRLAKKSQIDTVKFEEEFAIKNEKVLRYNPEKYWEILQNAIDKYILQSTKWECWGNNGFDIESKDGKDYIMDMNFSLEFALQNRKLMMWNVLSILHCGFQTFINKNHNCADFLDGWLVLHRKGATSAYKWEIGVIPGNMKDGTVIVEGLGNPEYLNCSSHGAGRVLSRKKAQATVKLEDFEQDMVGIMAKVWEDTKDESRFAYKNFERVLELQKDSIKVIHHITPLINIKW